MTEPSAAASCNGGATYDREFFDKQGTASYRSAGVVLDELFRLYRPGAVVDVGCGVGTWLRAARERGVVDYLGIDGPYLPIDQLWIPSDRYLGHDLTGPLDLSRRYDLVVCMEVGEHLPASAAHTLVDTLTSLAPVLLFSAAVPNQGGDGHVNEQWPRYWWELLAEHGFRAYDVLRPRVWADERIDWWYRQNVLLYAHDSAPLKGAGNPGEPLALVHPLMIDAIVTRSPAPPAAPPSPRRHPRGALSTVAGRARATVRRLITGGRRARPTVTS